MADDCAYMPDDPVFCYRHKYACCLVVKYDESALQEPELIPITTSARFACEFGIDGICAAHGTSIMDHDAITTTEEMTLDEAKRRYPDTDPETWARIERTMRKPR